MSDRIQLARLIRVNQVFVTVHIPPYIIDRSALKHILPDNAKEDRGKIGISFAELYLQFFKTGFSLFIKDRNLLTNIDSFVSALLQYIPTIPESVNIPPYKTKLANIQASLSFPCVDVIQLYTILNDEFLGSIKCKQITSCCEGLGRAEDILSLEHLRYYLNGKVIRRFIAYDFLHEFSISLSLKEKQIQIIAWSRWSLFKIIKYLYENMYSTLVKDVLKLLVSVLLKYQDEDFIEEIFVNIPDILSEHLLYSINNADEVNTYNALLELFSTSLPPDVIQKLKQGTLSTMKSFAVLRNITNILSVKICLTDMKSDFIQQYGNSEILLKLNKNNSGELSVLFFGKFNDKKNGDVITDIPSSTEMIGEKLSPQRNDEYIPLQGGKVDDTMAQNITFSSSFVDFVLEGNLILFFK